MFVNVLKSHSFFLDIIIIRGRNLPKNFICSYHHSLWVVQTQELVGGRGGISLKSQIGSNRFSFMFIHLILRESSSRGQGAVVQTSSRARRRSCCVRRALVSLKSTSCFALEADPGKEGRVSLVVAFIGSEPSAALSPSGPSA